MEHSQKTFNFICLRILTKKKYNIWKKIVFKNMTFQKLFPNLWNFFLRYSIQMLKLFIQMTASYLIPPNLCRFENIFWIFIFKKINICFLKYPYLFVSWFFFFVILFNCLNVLVHFNNPNPKRVRYRFDKLVFFLFTFFFI